MTEATETWAVADLWALCDRYPGGGGRNGLGQALRAACDHEHEHLADENYLGWTWSDVRINSSVLHQALLSGVIREDFHSRSQTTYRLIDRDRVGEALSAYLVAPPATSPADEEGTNPKLPKDAFDVIVGHDATKELLRRALAAPRPVHVLLSGPPATAKTLLLGDVARIPGARYALGSTTTKAGILDYLMAQPTCRVLVIDELDKGSLADYAALLSLMETGLISRLQHGRAEHERRQVWVIAGANKIDHLPAELLSRFAIRAIYPYSVREFETVATEVLVRREQVDPEVAREIARALRGHTTDVRTAVRCARLIDGSRGEIPTALALLDILAT